MSRPRRRLCVIGDIHGHLDILRGLLSRAALIDDSDGWAGADARLAVLGDLVDRGPDGIGVIDLLMHIESQAAGHGGEVTVLLGNHDLLLLAMWRYPELFESTWLRNGGRADDISRVSTLHVQWLQARPAMMLIDDDLLTHADAMLYLRYGRTIADVNDYFRHVLTEWDLVPLIRLMDEFSERDAFLREGGVERLKHFLDTFGAQRLIHGHSPITRVLGVPADMVNEAYVYADGLAVNVDHGRYRGGPGFVFEAC